VRLAGEAGLAVVEGSRGCTDDGPFGPRGRKGGVGAHARERGFGPETAQPRGSVFLFLFLISISFISFSFEQIIS
jgi:hypothetical protein